MKKLELKNLKVKSLSQDEKISVQGGQVILSIGIRCSVRNSCTRTLTKGLGCTIPSNPGGRDCIAQ